MTSNIEEILDRCTERMRAGEGCEEILREHPQEAGELRALLPLAADLQRLPDPQPSFAAIGALTAKLGAERQAAKPRVRFFSLPVLARAAAILLFVLVLGWGGVAASSNTVPGDFLYPVKRLTERVQFFLTVNREDKVELRIVFSEERLKEAVRKHVAGQGIDSALLTAMLDEAKAAADSASALSPDGRRFLVPRVAYSAEFQRRTLEEMQARASAGERQALTPYVERCTEQCMAACRLVSTMTGVPMAPVGGHCPICNRPLPDAPAPGTH